MTTPRLAPVTAAAEYLALTLARRLGTQPWTEDTATVGAMTGLAPESVSRLLKGADLQVIEDRRRQVDAYTGSACVWRCGRCHAIGPYSPGLTHFWAHFADAHRPRTSRALPRDVPVAGRRPSNVGPVCREERCGQPAECRGLCNKHYQQLRRGALLAETWPRPHKVKMPDLSAGRCHVEGADFVPDDEYSAAAAYAISICAECPVRVPCADYAIEARETGIWGMTRTVERQALRKKRGAA